ncbi:MAG: 50S ribosomal protein L11 methyltransferase [Methyloceanibacter sp.]|jgi:ribosomal protein L11 methyltransferase
MPDAPASAAPLEAKAATYLATIEVSAASADRIAATLEAAGAPAVMAVTLFERGRGRIEVSAHYAKKPSRKQLTRLIRTAADEQELRALRIEELADRDWVARAEGLRGPVRAGRFLVHGSHDRSKVGHGRFTLEIDAELAFGTAHHASTRGCLLALDALLKRRRPRAVVDIGTGTGILAIAIAKVLASRVVATDADAKAVVVAAANAKKNGVAPRFRVVRASGLAHPALRRVRADLLLANLAPPALLELTATFARHVAPGGVAVLSGIEQDQAGMVEARYRAAGFILKSRILLNGWTTLILVHGNMKPVRD